MVLSNHPSLFDPPDGLFFLPFYIVFHEHPISETDQKQV